MAPRTLTLTGIGVLAGLLCACGTAPAGNPVGAPPPSAPATTAQRRPGTPPLSRHAPPPAARQPKPPAVPTVGATAPPRRPKPPLLPHGVHSALGNTPTGAPWDRPGTPEWVAARWVTGFYEVLWDQGDPNAWASRVEPLTTAAYWGVLKHAVVPPGPASAAAWHKVVANRELDQVDILSAYRVDEAGYSATREVVLVNYEISVSTKAHPLPVYEPAQPAYLTLLRQGGHWLVAGFWAPLASTATAKTEPAH